LLQHRGPASFEARKERAPQDDGAGFAMNSETKTLDKIRAMAEQHGLSKALKLFPDGVKAAAERGLKPLGELPRGTTAISSPAPIFNPARFEREK